VVDVARDIGLGVKPPPRECNDKNCPFHGTLSVRGKVLVGKVISAKMDKTCTVLIERIRPVKKFERFMRCHYKIHAHNPPCINAKEGDIVKIAEYRRLAKTVAHTVIEKISSGEEHV